MLIYVNLYCAVGNNQINRTIYVYNKLLYSFLPKVLFSGSEECHLMTSAFFLFLTFVSKFPKLKPHQTEVMFYELSCENIIHAGDGRGFSTSSAMTQQISKFMALAEAVQRTGPERGDNIAPNHVMD